MDILDTIIEQKRVEVEALKSVRSIEVLMEACEDLPKGKQRSMRDSLESSTSGIISEFKRRSPSKGWLHADAKVSDIVPIYAANGASACSVLTDSDFFGGGLEDLIEARSLVDIPLLRKDFVVDEYQIYQAKEVGADAILLIAAVLTIAECQRFTEVAHSLGLEVLLEIHDPKEIAYVSSGIDMLGINNRNLGTFHTAIDNSFAMVEAMKQACKGERPPLLVSESGIGEPQTVVELRKVGFRGFLIGETFMKSEDVGATLSKFIETIERAGDDS